MKIGKLYFLPKPIPTVAALFFLAIFVWAGFWQLGRAQKKFADRDKRSANEIRKTVVLRDNIHDLEKWVGRRVKVTGKFDNRYNAWYANVKYLDEPGFLIITPLRLQNSNRQILVIRGWMPHRSGDFRDLPKIPAAPEGTLTFHGLMDRKPAVGIEVSQPDLGHKKWPKLLTYVNYRWYEKQLNSKFIPMVVKDLDSPHVGLTRDWGAFAQLREKMPAERNLGYAVQWWALATVLVIVFFIMTIRRKKPAETTNAG